MIMERNLMLRQVVAALCKRLTKKSEMCNCDLHLLLGNHIAD